MINCPCTERTPWSGEPESPDHASTQKRNKPWLWWSAALILTQPLLLHPPSKAVERESFPARLALGSEPVTGIAKNLPGNSQGNEYFISPNPFPEHNGWNVGFRLSSWQTWKRRAQVRCHCSTRNSACSAASTRNVVIAFAGPHLSAFASEEILESYEMTYFSLAHVNCDWKLLSCPPKLKSAICCSSATPSLRFSVCFVRVQVYPQEAQRKNPLCVFPFTESLPLVLDGRMHTNIMSPNMPVQEPNTQT